MNRCQGTTKGGSRCKKSVSLVLPGHKYCFVHYVKEESSSLSVDSLSPVLVVSSEIEGDCCICMEGYTARDKLSLGCGHSYHKSCLLEMIKKGWSTANVTFAHAKCPVCRERINDNLLDEGFFQFMRDSNNVYNQILDVVLPKLLDEYPDILMGFDGGDLVEYIINVCLVFRCSECKNCFYAGHKECTQELPEKDTVLCKECSNIVVRGRPVRGSCALHDPYRYGIWKCRFCCAVAAYKCGGDKNAHFCEKCHSRAGALVDFQTWENKDPLESFRQCDGKGRCPLGIEHPMNGLEFVLGCMICK